MFGDPFNHFVPARLNAHHSIGNLSPADLFSLYSWQFPVRRSGASRPHFRSSKKPGSFSPPGILTLPLLFHLCPFDILVPQDHWPPLLWGLSISIDHHSSLDLVLSRLFLFSLDQNLPPLPPAPLCTHTHSFQLYVISNNYPRFWLSLVTSAAKKATHCRRLKRDFKPASCGRATALN